MHLKCSVCNIFGHFIKDYANKPVVVTVKVWVPKKAMENEIEGKEDPNRKEEVPKQMKDKEKKTMDTEEVNSTQGKSGSNNRFAILDAVVEEHEGNITDHEMNNEEDNFVEPRKAKVASIGVADLMKSLKPRKRGPMGKVKNRKIVVGDAGGQMSSSSL